MVVVVVMNGNNMNRVVLISIELNSVVQCVSIKLGILFSDGHTAHCHSRCRRRGR